MKRLMPTALISVAFLFMGCAGTCPSKTDFEKVMSNWVGKDKSELIQRLGPPNYQENDGSGGKILIYKYNRNAGQIPGKAKLDYSGNLSYTYPTSIQGNTVLQFYVNSRGIIYHYRFITNEYDINSYYTGMAVIYIISTVLTLVLCAAVLK